MTYKEANLKIFERQKTPFVLFQPRVEPWFLFHKEKKDIPELYNNLDILQFYDKLDLSIRYINFSWPIKSRQNNKIKITEKQNDDKTREVIIKTEKGELIRKEKKGGSGSWITTKFPVEKKDDFLKLKNFYKNTVFTFSKEQFEEGEKIIENRGYPQFYIPRSPYQVLWIEWCSFDTLIYGLVDFPEVVEDAMKSIEDSYNLLFEEIVNYGKAKIINFGENIDANITSPKYFEKYCIPYYERKNKILKKAKLYTHIHIDGSFKPLLKYLKGLPFDGIEALTPTPQGDVEIEEIKENIGDKILIDGIPAVLFLPEYSEEDLINCIKKLIKLFYPNIVLGISDEMPMGTPFLEGVKKLKLISKYCKKKGII